MVAMAQKAGLQIFNLNLFYTYMQGIRNYLYFSSVILGLMSNLTPAWSRKDPKKRRDWKKFNTYFDEQTIKHRYKNY